MQETILAAVSGESIGENNRFMVGDVKQSIYRFRQAMPELFNEKYQRYPAEEGQKERKIVLSRTSAAVKYIGWREFYFSPDHAEGIRGHCIR